MEVKSGLGFEYEHLAVFECHKRELGLDAAFDLPVDIGGFRMLGSVVR
jgi:hypothetical protein